MSETTVRQRLRKPALAAALLASTMFGGGALVGHAWSATNPASPPITVTPEVKQAGFAELVSKVKPAVVNISTTESVADANKAELQKLPPELRQFFQQQMEARPVHALGSGFIVDPQGYIVTNNHVVDGAREITVTTNDGASHRAKIVGRDQKTDLALLKIDAGKPLPYVAFGDSDKAQVGDWVVAVGNPFGLGGTVTAGIISAHGRNIDAGPYDNFLQIDAPINPGNSGGPLFDQSGHVIGIDTAIFSPSGGSIGIGFAIPANLASHVVAQLRDHGKVERGWLGVDMQAITPALAKAMGLPDASGVLVDKVVPNSPAADKLAQGDVITAFNGEPVKTPRDLATKVADAKSGSHASLTVQRDGRQQAVEVTIGSPRPEKTAAADEAPQGGKVGIALAPLSDDVRGQLGVPPGVKGVVVAEVKPGSPAAESGLQAGDVITRIGADPVTSPDEAVAKIRAAEHAKKEALAILVVRQGAARYLPLELG